MGGVVNSEFLELIAKSDKSAIKAVYDEFVANRSQVRGVASLNTPLIPVLIDIVMDYYNRLNE